MMEISDQYLLTQIARKDLKCFESFMFRYEERVYNFVLKLVKLPELAEEITQDTFIKIWENAGKLSDLQSIPAWLYTTSKNHSLNMLKQMAARYFRETTYSASLPQTSDEGETAHEYKNLLFSFANHLPPKRREIFLLKIEKGLTNEEIGNQLHISPHTVKSQLQKSFFTIRQLLSDNITIVLILLYYRSEDFF
ncbi:hypothetical protein DVR12_26630 [Chitinophaga silvatica]|uniref:RNA polymerase sigma-70 factor n=1 Tax=Chitinophaga silvatica TaxID=2282649 RepID=A0A3E1Y2N6_9BACT|nr:sigma-70 family RNA polymerase sigma factor [Chitinophaga silvatica]RFS18777.1 hypothetical protein DVR12_26630 [Chitinophaga silvatica]